MTITEMQYSQADLPTACRDLARTLTTEEIIQYTNQALAGLPTTHFTWVFPRGEEFIQKPPHVMIAPNHRQAFIGAVRKQLEEGVERLKNSLELDEAKQIQVARILTAMGLAPYLRQEVSALIRSERGVAGER